MHSAFCLQVYTLFLPVNSTMYNIHFRCDYMRRLLVGAAVAGPAANTMLNDSWGTVAAAAMGSASSGTSIKTNTDSER